MSGSEVTDKFNKSPEDPVIGGSRRMKPPELPRSPLQTTPKEKTTLGGLGLRTLAEIIKSNERDSSEVPDQ